MTKIEWADETWNPITGCTPISEGCANCYARRMANRLRGRYGYPSDDPFRVTFHKSRLYDPLLWRKGRSVFVCSMGDLFHEDVQFDWIEQVFERMRENHLHTYMLLTKRPARVAEYWEWRKNVWLGGQLTSRWPEHVWLGVTAENQQRADERIPIMFQVPAAVRFVSIEPMLSDVDLRVAPCRQCNHQGDVLHWPCPSCKGRRFEYPDWVICGGETGPGARPMHTDWARSLRDQCVGASTPFFFKNMSGKQPIPEDLMIREFPN